MRLSISVNDQQVCRASLEKPGWLSAHINLSNGLEQDEPDRVWAVAYDKSEEPNSSTASWEGRRLSIGDKVQIEILPDGESDPPCEIRSSSKSPGNLFSDIEQARQLLSAVKTCDVALSEILDRASATEPPEELEKIKCAVTNVLWELGVNLIEPTLRRHPSLLPEAEALKIR